MPTTSWLDMVTCEACGWTTQVMTEIDQDLLALNPKPEKFAEQERADHRAAALAAHPCPGRPNRPVVRDTIEPFRCACVAEALDEQRPWVTYPDHAHTDTRCGRFIYARVFVTEGTVLVGAAAVLEVRWPDGAMTSCIWVRKP